MSSKKITKKEEGKIQLDLIHGFGSLGHSGLKNSFTFIEDDGIKLGFPIGKQFALRSIDRAEMSFIGFHEGLQKVTSICVSKNRKHFAVSGTMKGSPSPQLAIYTVRGENDEKERLFTYTESKSHAFVHMCFAEDPRFLVMLTGYEDSHLVFLDTSRMKPMGTIAINGSGTRVSISPRDSHIVCVSGDRLLKLYRVQENNFRCLGDIAKLNTDQNFTEHVWTDDNKLLVANDQARIYVIYNLRVVQVLDNCFNLSERDRQASVTALVCFSRGFAIGGDDGTFTIWIKNEDIDPENENQNYFNFLRTRKGPEGQTETMLKKAGIVSLDVSPTEDLLAVCFKNNDLATVSMNQLVPATADVVDPHKLRKLLNGDIRFDYLYNGFHNGAITSIDICVQRPLIATCSNEDSTIRIWNYANFRCELAVMFSVKEDVRGVMSPLLSLSFHPSGYYLAVGFVDRLEVFHVCSEELRSYRIITQVKNVNCVKFSNSGHMLAVAYPRPSHTNFWINVYNAYTFESLTLPLKGPVDTIKELIWTDNDETLVCCGLDGAICEWNVKQDFTARKDFSMANTGLKLTDMTYTHNGQILACGNEKGNPIIKLVQPKKNIQKNYPLACGNLNQITAFRGNFNTLGLIGGTDQGSITIFPGAFENGSYDYKPAHLSEIIKIIVSPDGKYVFTTGKDQCILVFQAKEISEEGALVSKVLGLKEEEETQKYNPFVHAVDENLADVVMVSQEEIDRFRSEIKLLRFQVEDLNTKMEIAAEEDRRRVVREKAKAEENMSMNAEAWQKRCEEIQHDKHLMEQEYENLLKLTENSHFRAIEELEMLYDKKLAYENEKYLQLEQEIVEEENKQNKMEKKAQRHHKTTIDRLEGQYREEFFKTQRIFDVNKTTADQIKEEYEEKLEEIEQEHESEIKDLTMTHNKEIGKLDDEISKLTSDNKTIKIEREKQQAERESMQKTEDEKMNESKHLKHKLKELNSTIELLTKSLNNRKEAVEDKKKKIEKYNVKINDMQKSKHVLSFQTTEMRKSLEPKEAQIDKMKEEVLKLGNEFESMLKSSQEQNDKLMKKEKKIEILQSEVDSKVSDGVKKDNLKQRIILDIFNAIRTKEEKEYAAEMKKLYRTYCAELHIKDHTGDPRGIKEMMRQIQYLEKSIFQMNRDTEKVVKRREQEIHRKTNENSDLICDLNILKKTNRRFEVQIMGITDENNGLMKERRALIDERNELRVTIAELTKETGHQNLLAKLSPPNNKPKISQSSPMLKLKSSKSVADVGEGQIANLKAQSISEKNKLSDYLAELDIYKQKLMQQEHDFNQIFETFERLGIDDEGNSAEKPFQLYKVTEGEDRFELEDNKLRQTGSERLHNLKPELNVQVSGEKTSQH